MPNPPNDATESILGFLFQGQYALLLLWQAEDDDDAIALETEDDVVFEGRGEIILAQLKHSRGTPPPLSIKNDGLWKAIRNWVRGAEAEAAAAPARFYSFVTAARIAEGSPLETAGPGANRTGEDEAALVDALIAEAESVRDAREAAQVVGDMLPYHDRAPGCASFLALSPEARALLVNRLRVLPELFSINEIESQVMRKLSDSVPSRQRAAVAQRLVEWWDGQVARALIGQRDRRILRRELVAKLFSLIGEHGPEALPDDFSLREPQPEELAEGRGGMIERQIRLVRGGGSRTELALVAWWRARGQRVRWVALDVSIAPDLEVFDERLKQKWIEVHGPMCDDCAGLPEDVRCRHGLDVLNWALRHAADEVVPPRPEWRHPFYAQGALQQLAEKLDVGWHPDYSSLLRAADGEEEHEPAAVAPRRGRGRSGHGGRKAGSR